MGLNDIPAVDFFGANTAVVWALWSWETSVRPAVWPIVRTKEGVFLLETKPSVLGGIRFHQTDSFVAVIELVWSSIVVPGFAHDKDIVATTEWIRVGCNGAEVDIRVFSGSLTG